MVSSLSKQNENKCETKNNLIELEEKKVDDLLDEEEKENKLGEDELIDLCLALFDQDYSFFK